MEYLVRDISCESGCLVIDRSFLPTGRRFFCLLIKVSAVCLNDVALQHLLQLEVFML